MSAASAPASLARGASSALVLGVLACAAPTLLAWNVAPSATFLNQALAFGLWGWFVLATAAWAGSLRRAAFAAREVLAVVLACIAAAAWSWGPGALPSSLALSLIGSLLAAAVVLAHGAALGVSARPGAASDAFSIFCVGWLAAGLAGTAIGGIQVFWPDLPDGQWLASTSIPGRAVGNLRQPNHLSSVLLWACVALIALQERHRWPWLPGLLMGSALVSAVVLTASRTGLVSVVLLALWGLADRRLSARSRLMLLAAPLAYALAWWLMAQWGAASEHRFGGAERLAETDISGSRFGIWANTWELIRRHPWGGVGLGEFNIAWSLSPFPGRPTAFFDHTHNLPLQLAVELGLPLATMLVLLLLAGLWRVARAAFTPAAPAATAGADGDAADGLLLRCAWVMVLMIGLHSLLEYPLWYAYFLLPAAWVWGLALGVAARAPASAAPLSATPGTGAPLLAIAGAVLALASAASVVDYRRVVVIFNAPADAAPLAERIAEGRRSVLFAHHAEYAAATTGQGGADGLAPFRIAGHYLLDARLMQAWAEALHEAGQVEAARHVAARLREFRNPASAEFLEVCALPATRPPWPCEPPHTAIDWRQLAR